MSWVATSLGWERDPFPIQNLPLGVFSVQGGPKRIGCAIGSFVLDLSQLASAGLLDGLGFEPITILSQSTLNDFMSLERPAWRALRARLAELLQQDGANVTLRSNEPLCARALVPLEHVQMHLPCAIGDYTDFYSSRAHATNVGTMFRGADNALQPNWLHLPVGYHGRSSSVVVSGTDIVRPCGQVHVDRTDESKGSVFSPCRLLDFELEVAFFIGGASNPLGQPLTLENAESRIFGIVLMNDWSARDLQAWEYVPLGPFTAKNFATSISPWIVSLDALEPFRCSPSSGAEQVDPRPLPYLADASYASSSYDVHLEVALKGKSDTVASPICITNLRSLYWNFKQQLVHHSISGCNMRAGDLLGTGTISGVDVSAFGSMLELSWRGSRDIALVNSSALAEAAAAAEGSSAPVSPPPAASIRKFLQDGDAVIMTGCAQGDGYCIGFGEVKGTILPAALVAEAPAVVAPAPIPPVSNLKLYSYWRSTCSWRVRIALHLKGLSFEYVPMDLSKLVGNVTATLPAAFGDQKNKMQQVPVLEFVDTKTQLTHALTQSLAIIHFVEESFPLTGSGLLGSGALVSARVREIAELVNSGIQPLQNLSLLRQVKQAVLISSPNESGGGGGGEEGAVVDSNGFAKAQISKGLAALEALVSAAHANASKESLFPLHSHLFAAGTLTPTLADICLVPQVYNASRFGVVVSDYPCLSRVVALCNALPAFAKAHPDQQPDAPSSAPV